MSAVHKTYLEFNGHLDKTIHGKWLLFQETMPQFYT